VAESLTLSLGRAGHARGSDPRSRPPGTGRAL